MTSFRSLDNADVKGKRVLVRVDFNVPMENGAVTDATRIERAAPTIREIADNGGKVILLSHFGRPKGREPRDSLEPVAVAAAGVIGRPSDAGSVEIDWSWENASETAKRPMRGANADAEILEMIRFIAIPQR